MILGAGLGTRLRPFSDYQPKPLIPLMGVPILEFAFDALSRAGLQRVVINHHHLSDRLQEGARKLLPPNMNLEWSDEKSILLGSAGGLKKGSQSISGDHFVFYNGDIVSGTDLSALIEFHEQQNSKFGVELTLTMAKVDSKESYREIEIDSKTNLVTRAGELKRGAPFFNGIGIISKVALAKISSDTPSNFLEALLIPLIERKKVAGFFPKDSFWLDFGTPKAWHEAHFKVMELLESNAKSSVLSLGIRQRIANKNNRRDWMRWEDKISNSEVGGVFWKGNGYWAGMRTKAAAQKPIEFGPNSVFYGTATQEKYMNGVGWNEMWVECD
jgi:NDP-sugar pyrophosphorylase family protein